MTPPDEKMWRTRFLLLTLARLGGLLLVLLGVAILYSDLLRPGGWPQVGAVLVILGTLTSLLAPRLLNRRWDQAHR